MKELAFTARNGQSGTVTHYDSVDEAVDGLGEVEALKWLNRGFTIFQQNVIRNAGKVSKTKQLAEIIAKLKEADPKLLKQTGIDKLIEGM